MIVSAENLVETRHRSEAAVKSNVDDLFLSVNQLSPGMVYPEAGEVFQVKFIGSLNRKAYLA
nr:hypothetical protein [Hahella ganghwensis]